MPLAARRLLLLLAAGTAAAIAATAATAAIAVTAAANAAAAARCLCIALPSWPGIPGHLAKLLQQAASSTSWCLLLFCKLLP
jgi:hypothetical protein